MILVIQDHVCAGMQVEVKLAASLRAFYIPALALIDDIDQVFLPALNADVVLMTLKRNAVVLNQLLVTQLAENFCIFLLRFLNNFYVRLIFI